jgi:seryl-tRNA synthetase
VLDPQFIVDNKQRVQSAADNKDVDVDVDEFVDIYSRRGELLQQIEELRAERNDNANEIKKSDGKPPEDLIKKGREIKQNLVNLEEKFDSIDDKYTTLIYKIPNVHGEDTPVGRSEKDNTISETIGEKPEYNFEPKQHDELGETLGLIDQEHAAKVSGSRFAYLFGDIVKMQFGLIRLGLDTLTSQQKLEEIINDSGLKNVSAKPFIPALPPVMMRTEPYQRTARLKPQDVTYKLADDDAWLIGSAEHSLCSYHMDEIINSEAFPIRYVGYSTSFRREAGSYGQDTTGIFRLHHFDKLEMESFTKPEDGRKEHQLMIEVQKYLMKQLGLPFQVVIKCTADLGAPNYRGVDIETWFSGQKQYRETHSADFMTDYQARRLNTRYEDEGGDKHYVHTNDATVFAMGRTLAAIIEYYQQVDGSIVVPEVLRDDVGRDVIHANAYKQS